MYSGSIITLKDLKFELLKNINRFCYINYKTNFKGASFSLSSKIIIFYPYSFMTLEDFQLEKRVSSIFLFLILHQICELFKTNLNNNHPLINSPNLHLDKNLNLIFTDFGVNDSGLIFESILSENAINSKAMLSNEKSEDLFDIRYYIKDNFDDLKKN